MTLAAAATAFAEGDSARTYGIVGAERMVPLVSKLTLAFTSRHPATTFDVQGGGSEVGLQKLTDGQAAVAMTGRPVTPAEFGRARRKLGSDLVGIPIALDAVVFFVPAENSVTSLTIEEVRRILSPKPTSWTDFGLSGGTVRVYFPATRSDSAEILRGRVLKEMAFSKSVTQLRDVVPVAEAIAQDRNGIGFSGMAGQPLESLRIVPLRRDAQSPAVLPTAETMESREYPLAHYLYLYVAGQPSAPIRDFIAFCTGPDGRDIVRTADTGAVPLPLTAMQGGN